MAPEWFNDPAAFCTWIDENLGPRPDGMSIDRIDNGDENSPGPGYVPGNLKWSPWSDQNVNRRKPVSNTSGYIGVYYNKKYNRWYAQMGHSSKTFHLGYFDTPEEAAAVRDDCMFSFHGSAVTLNFPLESGRIPGAGEPVPWEWLNQREVA